MRSILTLAALALSLSTLSAQEPAEGQWKTAFVKRGFCGAFLQGSLGGPRAVIRSRTPIPFDGTKVRIMVTGVHKTEVQLENMCLVKGVDDKGTVSGAHYPILFKGQPTISFTMGTKAWSDEVAIPIAKGTWYVQDSYRSEKMPYAYDVDRHTSDVKGSEGKPLLAKQIMVRVGIVEQIDVFTTDTRPTILCFGDSITHGWNATPNEAKRYPDILGQLLDRPTLNLGVNGDLIKWAGGVPRVVNGLKGVDAVIFLMGINDIMCGATKTLGDYTDQATRIVSGLKQMKVKIYFGTIMPFKGYKRYDAEMDTLRREINDWIRSSSEADGVIDFDAAIRDPADPAKMQESYQSDWLHPSDAGYQKMAEAAAAVIKQAPATAE